MSDRYDAKRYTEIKDFLDCLAPNDPVAQRSAHLLKHSPLEGRH